MQAPLYKYSIAKWKGRKGMYVYMGQESPHCWVLSLWAVAVSFLALANFVLGRSVEKGRTLSNSHPFPSHRHRRRRRENMSCGYCFSFFPSDVIGKGQDLLLPLVPFSAKKSFSNSGKRRGGAVSLTLRYTQLGKGCGEYK